MRPSAFQLGIFVLSALVSGTIVSTPALGQDSAPAQVVAKPLRLPATRVEAERTLDDSVAAVLVGAVAEEMGSADVQVQFTHVDVGAGVDVMQPVQGSGRLQLERDAAWLPFTFQAQIALDRLEVSAPLIVLGDVRRLQAVQNDSLRDALQAATADRLRAEFVQQTPAVRLVQLLQASTDSRYHIVESRGLVDFGRQGATPIAVHGVYDTVRKRWSRVQYELGPAATRTAATTDL